MMILALTWPKWLTLCVSFAAVWLLVFSILCFLRLLFLFQQTPFTPAME